MGEFRSAGRDESELSWTNETLPLEVRRALLDKALEEFRAARASGGNRSRSEVTSVRPGEAGSDRDSSSKKDKPQA